MALVSEPTGANMGGVYTNPYQLTINGLATWLACDDFATDISNGDTWTAKVNTLSDAEGGAAKFTLAGVDIPTSPSTATPSSPAYTLAEMYDAAALIALQMLENPTAGSGNGDYSYAIWQIFDPIAYKGYSSSLSSSDIGNIATDLTDALQWAHGSLTNLAGTPYASTNLGELGNIVIYTPVYPAGGPNAGQVIPPGVGYPPGAQEFFGLVPEAPSPALLAFEFFVLLCGGLFFRRRLATAPGK